MRRCKSPGSSPRTRSTEGQQADPREAPQAGPPETPGRAMSFHRGHSGYGGVRQIAIQPKGAMTSPVGNRLPRDASTPALPLATQPSAGGQIARYPPSVGVIRVIGKQKHVVTSIHPPHATKIALSQEQNGRQAAAGDGALTYEQWNRKRLGHRPAHPPERMAALLEKPCRLGAAGGFRDSRIPAPVGRRAAAAEGCAGPSGLLLSAGSQLFTIQHSQSLIAPIGVQAARRATFHRSLR